MQSVLRSIMSHVRCDVFQSFLSLHSCLQRGDTGAGAHKPLGFLLVDLRQAMSKHNSAAIIHTYIRTYIHINMDDKLLVLRRVPGAGASARWCARARARARTSGIPAPGIGGFGCRGRVCGPLLWPRVRVRARESARHSPAPFHSPLIPLPSAPRPPCPLSTRLAGTFPRF